MVDFIHCHGRQVICWFLDVAMSEIRCEKCSLDARMSSVSTKSNEERRFEVVVENEVCEVQ
jgi:hypothetical protein